MTRCVGTLLLSTPSHRRQSAPVIMLQVMICFPTVLCRWSSCNGTVNTDIAPTDFMINYGHLLPPMLADGVRIMIYVGMEVTSGLRQPCDAGWQSSGDTAFKCEA